MSYSFLELKFFLIITFYIVSGVTMREKKSGALSKVQKIKKRLSHSFGRLCKY